MTKPEDIPQDVWDRAIAIETGYEGGANGRRPIFIARAILSAVEGEREACAMIADGELLLNRDGQVCIIDENACPSRIASAIRNRKES